MTSASLQGSAHENLVQPSGVEPESRHSERRALSHWTMAGWYGYVYSNHGLNVRSVLSCPLNDTRTNIWLAAQGSNLKPLRSERSALPNCASGQLAGGERVERPKPASKTGGLPLTEPPVKLCGSSRTQLLRCESLAIPAAVARWSGGWESNPRLESHNLPSWPLDDLRHKTLVPPLRIERRLRAFQARA